MVLGLEGLDTSGLIIIGGSSPLCSHVDCRRRRRRTGLNVSNRYSLFPGGRGVPIHPSPTSTPSRTPHAPSRPFFVESSQPATAWLIAAWNEAGGPSLTEGSRFLGGRGGQQCPPCTFRHRQSKRLGRARVSPPPNALRGLSILGHLRPGRYTYQDEFTSPPTQVPAAPTTIYLLPQGPGDTVTGKGKTKFFH